MDTLPLSRVRFCVQYNRNISSRKSPVLLQVIVNAVDWSYSFTNDISPKDGTVLPKYLVEMNKISNVHLTKVTLRRIRITFAGLVKQ